MPLWVTEAILFMSARIKIWWLRSPHFFIREQRTESNLSRSMWSRFFEEDTEEYTFLGMQFKEMQMVKAL